MSTTADLIRWPVNDDRYEDTGEDGLFVYAVALEPTEPDACHVDVGAYLSLPDVLLTRDPQLYDTTPYEERARTRVAAVARTLRARGDEELYQKLSHGLMGADELSDRLRSAVFFGATSASWSSEADGYFQPTPEDLTAEGKSLYDALTAAHGGYGLRLLTFLDT